jgi:hypothetical protein
MRSLSSSSLLKCTSPRYLLTMGWSFLNEWLSQLFSQTVLVMFICEYVDYLPSLIILDRIKLFSLIYLVCHVSSVLVFDFVASWGTKMSEGWLFDLDFTKIWQQLFSSIMSLYPSIWSMSHFYDRLVSPTSQKVSLAELIARF